MPADAPSPQAPYILALDLGTSSARTHLFDARGNQIAGGASRKIELRTGADGASEMDPDALVEALCDCIDETLAQAGRAAGDIAAVAICTFVSNLLGIDAGGSAVTPVITYADTRAAPDAEALRERLDEAETYQRTGARFHPSYLNARFAWLRRTRPDWLKQVKRWVFTGDYLYLKLFGRLAASYSVASWSGLLDRRALAWDAPLLAALHLSPEHLPALTDIDRPFQGLRPEFAARWPALAQIPWFPAVGDGAAANIGSDCAAPDRVTVSMGTSSAVRVVLDGSPQNVPAGLWCYRVDRRRSLLGGALTEGGNVYAWLKQTLDFSTIPDVDTALLQRPPDAHRLTFLPLIAGERSPGWVGGARAAVTGIRLTTIALDLLQAGIESVLLRVAQIYELLLPSLSSDVEVVASGGAFTHSPFIQRALADVLGCPVTISLAPEASARGTALLALEALGLLPDVSAAPRLAGPRLLSDPQRHAVYQAALQRQKDLYRRIIAEKNTP
jgi:gluconokinase